MIKIKQLNKNVKLSAELAEYIVANPKAVKNIPAGASYVVFSSSDQKLNKSNSKLITSLKSEGKQVVKVVQKHGTEEPWSFSLAI